MCLGNQGGNEINRQADQWMLTLEGPWETMGGTGGSGEGPWEGQGERERERERERTCETLIARMPRKKCGIAPALKYM